MNVTNQDQVMSGGTIIGHGEPAVWATTIDDQKPERRKRVFCKKAEGSDSWHQTKPEHQRSIGIGRAHC